MELNNISFFVYLMFGAHLFSSCETRSPPHIITIIADDLGWNDVGFHGSTQLSTPNIDALAYNGIILNSHYVQPLCTPSRAAFLTGKYPIHTGMQHSVILEPEPRGVPLSEKFLSEHLKSIGYTTRAVGKWHLGFFKKEYTPTYRGFESHYGYWNGFQDYYNQSVKATFTPSMMGFDLRRNFDLDYESSGNYSTYLYTNEAVNNILDHDDSKPLFLYLAHLAPHTGNVGNAFQAPDELIAKFMHIEDPQRRVYAAMVSALDQGVGEVVSALRKKGMLENSIILFMSDNGAPTYGIHANRGSNYPLRGQKNSPWEGGIRGVAAIWSPLFNNMKRVYDEMIHITDWMPTFWEAIGRDVKELGNIDGISVWNALKDNLASPREEFVINIDPIDGYASVRKNEWKMIQGFKYSQKYNNWYGNFGNSTKKYDLNSVLTSKTSAAISGFVTQNQIKSIQNNVTFNMKPLLEEELLSLQKLATLKCSEKVEDQYKCDLTRCLFNIKEDPCERKNLINDRGEIYKVLMDLMESYEVTSVVPNNVMVDEEADPKKYGGVWVNWLDEKEEKVSSVFDDFSPTALTAFKAFCVITALSVSIVVFAQILKMKCCERANDSYGEKKFFRNFTLESKISRDRNLIIPSVSVAQRVVMFEDLDHSLLKDSNKV